MTAPSNPTADADGWISWAGGECPLRVGQIYQKRYRDGLEGAPQELRSYATSKAIWEHDEDMRTFDIIAYRIVQP